MDDTIKRYAANLNILIGFIKIDESDKDALTKGINAMVLGHERITRELITALSDLENAHPNDDRWDYAAATENARRLINKYSDNSINDNLTINEKP